MKKKLLTLVALLATTPLLVQCASQSDIKNLNYQIRIVNKKIDDMKEGTVGQMQQRQAASSSQMDQLKSEILILKGHLEEMAHFNRQLKEQNKELEASLSQYSSSLQNKIQQEREEKENKIHLLEEKLSRNQETLKSIQKARIKEAERKAAAAARAAEEARNRAKASQKTLSENPAGGILNIKAGKKKIISTSVMPLPVDPTSAPAVKQNSPSGSNTLELAESEYANGNYKKAYKLYEKFISSNQNSAKGINGRFMMGECLFFQKEYDQAILQYQKIISNHPGHPRAASSLLKQGMAFEKLADNETAKIIYKKIIGSYPSSPEAAKAKERGNKLQ